MLTFQTRYDINTHLNPFHFYVLTAIFCICSEQEHAPLHNERARDTTVTKEVCSSVCREHAVDDVIISTSSSSTDLSG